MFWTCPKSVWIESEIKFCSQLSRASTVMNQIHDSFSMMTKVIISYVSHLILFQMCVKLTKFDTKGDDFKRMWVTIHFCTLVLDIDHLFATIVFQRDFTMAWW